MPKTGAHYRSLKPNSIVAVQPQHSPASGELPPITVKGAISLAISEAEQALFNLLFGPLIETVLTESD
jgi:hypothetical protein